MVRKQEERARRYNKGKRRYELIPHDPLGYIADVYTRGAHKYSIYKDSEGNLIKGSEIPIDQVGHLEMVEDGSNNWRKGLPWMETIGAVERHIAEWKRRKDIDPDLKTRNLANAAWGLLSLMEFATTHPELDDRPIIPMKKIGLDIDGVLADFVAHIVTYAGHPEFRPRHWNTPIIRKAFEEIKTEPEFWRTIPVLTNPEDIPFEPHCYITSRSIDKEVTQAWLDSNGFPTATLYSLGSGESKIETAKAAGIDIFVDDYYRNFVELNNAGIPTFLFTASHNEAYDVGSKRISNLKELI